MPTGIPKTPRAGTSEHIQQLLDMQRDLSERIAAERRKEKARTLLLQFCHNHGLTALDLRNTAKVLGDRHVSDAPVMTKQRKRVGNHLMKPAKGKVGKAIRAARMKANLSNREVGERVGVHSGLVGKWENGGAVAEKHQARLLSVLKLPKDLLPNGAAAP